MSTIISRELLEKAVRLHGHLGPFLVLGLKMSLRAKKILGRKPSRCEIATISSKPYLCAVDGIKAVIGNAVTVKEDDGLSARFSNTEGKEIVFRVKRDLVKKYAKGPWEKREEYAHEVMKTNDERLFEYLDNL
jgi:formylmethanofuran dehydrogenase subunit E